MTVMTVVRVGVVRLLAVVLLAVGLVAVPTGEASASPGALTYWFQGFWGGYGSNAGQFIQPSGIAVDAAGDVFVADTLNNRVQHLSPSGAPLASWGTAGTGATDLLYPSSIAIGATSGLVYVADTANHRVQVFTPAGLHIRSIGSAGTGDGQFTSMGQLALDGAENVYVADPTANRIQSFTSAGAFLAGWGAAGFGSGQFQSPQGVAVSPSGLVYVADTGNDRIQVFTPDGQAVGAWSGGEAPMTNPTRLEFDAVGNVFVLDEVPVVRQYTSGGSPVAQWGEYGPGTGQFDGPRDLAVSGSLVHVLDWSKNGVLTFGPDDTDPTVELVTPADGATYSSGDVVTAAYSCADTGGSGVQSCVGTVDDGSPIDTSLGDHSFEVTATDAAGNTATVTHQYTVTGDAMAPTIDLVSPAEGQVVDRGADLDASYTCADEGGSGLATCEGDVPSGYGLDTATRGAYTFTVTATDNMGNTTSVTHHWTVRDATDPSAVIRSPSADGIYAQGEEVLADYECTDDGGAGIASCEGDVADGAAIDTSTPGRHTFSVTATDGDGNTGGAQAGYYVQGTSVVTVTDHTASVVAGDAIQVDLSITNNGMYAAEWPSASFETSLPPLPYSTWGCDPEIQVIEPFATESTRCSVPTFPTQIGTLSVTASVAGQYFDRVYAHPFDVTVTAAEPSEVPPVPAGSIGSGGSGAGQLDDPRGVAIVEHPGLGILLHVGEAGNQRVQVFDVETGSSSGLVPLGFTPGDLDVDQDGNVYVTDPAADRVVVYDDQGQHVRNIAVAPLDEPRGIAVDGFTGTLFVSGAASDTVRRFQLDGTPEAQWGGSGSALGQLDDPRGIAVTESYVYVAERGNDRVQGFSRDGTLQTAWGNHGTAAGQFTDPVDLTAIEGFGVVVLEPGRAQQFDFGGRYLAGWSTAGGSSAITGLGADLYVAESALDRMDRYSSPRPSVALVLEVDEATVAVGEAIHHHVTLTNTGNVALTGLTITMPSAPACEGVQPALAPGAHRTIDCSYLTGPEDVGIRRSLARVTSEAIAWGVESNDVLTIVRGAGPRASVTKLVAEGATQLGSDLHYQLWVANTGAVPLTGVAVSDAHAPACDGPVVDLQPGEYETVYCQHTTTIDDRGTYENTATVDADQIEPVTSNTVSTSVTADGPLIAVLAVDERAVLVGAPVHYHVTVLNDGEDPLAGVEVNGWVPECSGTLGTIEPGQRKVFDCTHTATAGDLPILNNVVDVSSAVGMWAQTNFVQTEVREPVAAMTVEKAADQTSVAVGGAITYHVTVENTGDVPLTGVTVADPHAPGCAGPLPTVAVGASQTVDCTYTTRLVDRGTYTNTATVDTAQTPPMDSNAVDVTVTAPFLPDASIRRGTPPAVGDDVYDPNGGANQTRTGSARPGTAVTYTVGIQNDGSSTDTVLVAGRGGVANRFTVRYTTASGANITPMVVAGTYRVRNLAPGAQRTIRLTVTPLSGAARGARLERLVRLTSVGNPALRDAVKAVTTRT